MKRLTIAAFALLLCGPLFAQSASTYVSRLHATVDGSSVKLAWTDSDLSGASYLVYRATQEITSDNLAQATKIAEVPAGQQSYVDSPPDMQGYYYAVLVRDKDGKVYDVLIPFRNKTTDPRSVAIVATSSDLYAAVTKLTAKVQQDKVVLSFSASRPDHELAVYRSTNAIRTVSDLLAATAVGLIPSSDGEFRDAPVAGIPYYYAIVDTNMLRTGAIALDAGRNSTSQAVTVPLSAGGIGSIELAPERPRPLPFLIVSSPIQPGTQYASPSTLVTTERKALSPAASQAVQMLLSTLPKSESAPLVPLVLDPDKSPAPAASGDQYELQSILTGPFAARQWGSSIQALTGYLQLARAADFTNRARFYLGEAYYFSGDYRRAFMEFLVVEDALPTETQPWVDALFQKLHELDTASSAPADSGS